MRRAPFLVLVLLLALPAGASAQERPSLGAQLAACESGPDPAQRFAIFIASMPALAGTRQMSMRFDLMERRDGARRRWRRLTAPAFGRWDRSKEPGAAGFIYTKRVERLKEAASYRAVVRFRWVDRDGEVQRQARRTTPVCAQPSQRPNLVVEGVDVLPGPDGATSRYLVRVLNEGRTAAPAFTLGMVAAQEDLMHDVPGLVAGGRTTVEMVAPRCPAGASVDVMLDVRNVVRESSERDNRSISPCDGR